MICYLDTWLNYLLLSKKSIKPVLCAAIGICKYLALKIHSTELFSDHFVNIAWTILKMMIIDLRYLKTWLSLSIFFVNSQNLMRHENNQVVKSDLLVNIFHMFIDVNRKNTLNILKSAPVSLYSSIETTWLKKAFLHGDLSFFSSPWFLFFFHADCPTLSKINRVFFWSEVPPYEHLLSMKNGF
jgi:hypothetical protein